MVRESFGKQSFPKSQRALLFGEVAAIEREIDRVKALHKLGQLETSEARQSIKELVNELDALVMTRGSAQDREAYKVRKMLGFWAE